jgi:hypothetical protein
MSSIDVTVVVVEEEEEEEGEMEKKVGVNPSRLVIF